MEIKEFLIKSMKLGIILVFLTPLILGPFGLNMSEYPKAVFFRSLVEIIFVFYVFLILLNSAYIPKKSALLLSIIVFDAILIIASIAGINFYRSFFGEMQRGEGIILHLHLLAFFIVIIGLLRKKEDWMQIFKATAIVSGITCIAAVLQQLKIFSFYNVEPVRLSGTFSNPDLFGSYLVLSIFLTIFLLISEKKKNWNILWIFLIILNFCALILSGTRASWIGFAFGVVSIYVLNYKNLSYKKRIYSLLIVLFFSVSAFLLPFIIEKAHLEQSNLSQRIMGIYNIDISNRLTIWEIAFRAFKDKPILGWGFESFSFVSDKYFKSGYTNGIYFDRPHNKVAEVLSGSGIMGIASYVAIFFIIFYLIFKYSKLWNGYNNKPGILFGSVIFALFVSGFVQNMFGFDHIGTYILFFLAAGFVNNNFSNLPKINFNKFDKPAYAEKFIFVITFAFIMASILYQINIKPTIAAMNFDNYFKYEKTDLATALAGYKKGTVMNTLYDKDLIITFIERSVISLENGSASSSGNEVVSQLLAVKPILYKYIDEKDGGSDGLYGLLARIDEWSYLVRQDKGYLDIMRSDLGEATKFNPNIPVFYQLAGEMEILQNNYSVGEKYIEKSCEMDIINCGDNRAELYRTIGVAYFKKGDYKTAIENFQKTLDIDYASRKKGLASMIKNPGPFIDSIATMYCNYFKDSENCKKVYEKGIEVYPEYKDIFEQRLNAVYSQEK